MHICWEVIEDSCGKTLFATSGGARHRLKAPDESYFMGPAGILVGGEGSQETLCPKAGGGVDSLALLPGVILAV